ncbi:MAG: hypothetical protein ACKO23_14080 [Gemmataceae bacterium]
MCCFSRPVQRVSNTQIFARASSEGRQFVVYSMKMSAKEDLAMILPLPTPKASDEDAVRFINLDKYADFFQDMELGFLPPPSSNLFGRALPKAAAVDAPKLKVIDVGSFEASFVPQVKDFARLDERFRLPASTWNELPAYKDFGFAVFKLKSGDKKIHPMAFEFPRRDPEILFFPTVHIHDGKIHQTAMFDHNLYCQKSGGENLMRWTESRNPASAFMQVHRTSGIVDKSLHVHRLILKGRRSNRDTLLS